MCFIRILWLLMLYKPIQLYQYMLCQKWRSPLTGTEWIAQMSLFFCWSGSVTALSSLPLVFCIVAITGAPDTHRCSGHKDREWHRALCLVLGCCEDNVLWQHWTGLFEAQSVTPRDTHTHTHTTHESRESEERRWRRPPTCHTERGFDSLKTFLSTELTFSELFQHLFRILSAADHLTRPGNYILIMNTVIYIIDCGEKLAKKRLRVTQSEHYTPAYKQELCKAETKRTA